MPQLLFQHLHARKRYLYVFHLDRSGYTNYAYVLGCSRYHLPADQLSIQYGSNFDQAKLVCGKSIIGLFPLMYMPLLYGMANNSRRASTSPICISNVWSQTCEKWLAGELWFEVMIIIDIFACSSAHCTNNGAGDTTAHYGLYAWSGQKANLITILVMYCAC